MKKKSRLLAILLALAMIVTYMPALAFAEDGDDDIGFNAWLKLYYEDGKTPNYRFAAVPGITLNAKATAEPWDDEEDMSFTYDWKLSDEELDLFYWDEETDEDKSLDGYKASDFLTIESNGDTAVLKFKSIKEAAKTPEDEKAIQEIINWGSANVQVILNVKNGDKERSDDRWINIRKDYFELVNDPSDIENIGYRERVNYSTELYYVSENGQRTRKSEADFKWTKGDPFDPNDENAEWWDSWRNPEEDSGQEPWDWEKIPELSEDDDIKITKNGSNDFILERKSLDDYRVTLFILTSTPDNDYYIDFLTFYVDGQSNDLADYEINVLDRREGEWSIYVDKRTGISLNLEVKNYDGQVLPEDVYDLIIEKEAWDEDDRQYFSPAENGKLELGEDGTATYLVHAVAKDDSGFVGHTFYERNPEHGNMDGTYVDLVYYKSISSCIMKFPDQYKSTGEKPFMDYYSVKRGIVPKLTVLQNGNILREGTDFSTEYYELEDKEGEPKPDASPLTSFPTKVGYYQCVVIGKNDYSGENGRVIVGITENPGVNEVQALIDALNTTTPDEAAVAKARAEYDKLSADEKALVDISKLTAAEKKIADNKAAQERAAEAARQGVVDKAVAKVKISKPVAAKKAVTVKWNKLSSKDKKKATNIEIWICPNKKFSAADTKIVTVGKGKASKKVKGLKAKTKYYVKVRAIKKVGGEKHYKAWSKVKSVKTK